ncbi:MAG: hypothetical protein MUF34_20705 [Polyangiaceae bacterium]|nr:hypothetical protein [Polyangiaceae bacterium]
MISRKPPTSVPKSMTTGRLRSIGVPALSADVTSLPPCVALTGATYVVPACGPG